MFKKYLIITLLTSQAVSLKAVSEKLLNEELFQNIVHRNETLRQLGRQVTPDPFEEKIVANKKNGESVTEKIKIFVTQQNSALSIEKQPEYLLKSEEKIQNLKKKLISEQERTNSFYSICQFICTLGALCFVDDWVKYFKGSNDEKARQFSYFDAILPGACTVIAIGLRYLKNDLESGIDSCTNSAYSIATLKIEIQQQQKTGQAASVNENNK